MTDRVQISEKVKAICRQHYKNSCAGCPIRPACHGWGPTHTQEQLDRLVARANEMAEKIHNAT